MSNPSSLSPRRISEEDSSGSEAGSDVSVEPETDRFGFIVTNGSTAGSVGPSPELVRQREAKWINIMGQWDQMLMKKSNKVKTQCQKGIPASLRAKCWPLLCGAYDQMKRNDKLYECLKAKPALQSWVDVIERDLDRQFPFHEMFHSKNGHGQQGLFQVLKVYTQYRPQEGYCQAQGPVAAVLLMNMPAEEAFWCLVQISEQYLPGYYNPLLEGVLFDAALLTWAVKKTCPAVHKHLERHGVEPLMFATDWLMCLFTRHLPFNTLLRVWDIFFCYGVRVLLQVAVVLVRRALGRPDQRKRCQGQVETLECLRGIREQIQDEDDAFIAEVFSVPLSAKDLEKQMEKELLKWRKDRPSSTFDPRGRCQGYRTACARARQRHEEQERRERESGNLSVPLARSASTLSLSPSLLRKRWRKGGKVNAGEGERRGIVRHLSMGAREDWKSWTETNFRTVQCFQEEEDAGSEGHKASSEVTAKVQRGEETEREGENTTSEAVIIKEQVEMVEIKPTEEEESRLKETEEEESRLKETEEEESRLKETEEEESRLKETEEEESRLKQTEECEVVLKHEEETPTGSINDHEGDEGHATEETTECEREEKPAGEFNVQDQQTQDCREQEEDVKHKSEKREREESESRPVDEDEGRERSEGVDEETDTAAVMCVSESSNEEQEIQSDLKPRENSEQEQSDSDTETNTETRPDSETNNSGTESTHETPTSDAETQRGRREVITETQEEKHDSSESFQEPGGDESAAGTTAETDQLAQTQNQNGENGGVCREATAKTTQTESGTHEEVEEEPLIMTSSGGTQENQQPPFQKDAGSEDTTTEPNEDKVCVSVQEDDGAVLTEHQSESDSRVSNQPTTEETPRESRATESVEPTEQEETLTQSQNNDSVDGAEPKTPGHPMSRVGSAAEEQTVRNSQESPAVESEAFTRSDPTDAPIPANDDPEKDRPGCPSTSVQPPPSHHGRRFSADVCVRKPSGSRGSTATRRLSEDLFTDPQNARSQKIPNREKTDSAVATATKATPDARDPADVSSGDVTAGKEPHQQPEDPKSLSLFGRLRRKQPRNNKAKTKIQVPKILIQDFSDVKEAEEPVREDAMEKLTSKERRRMRRERERRDKEEERLKKKKDEEKERKKKGQTRGKGRQGQKDKNDVSQTTKTDSKTPRLSATYTESYF